MAMFREFFLIVAGALIGSVLGGLFAMAVGLVSPDFINYLAHPHLLENSWRFATAVGMICGLLLGAGTMAVGRLIQAIRFVGSRVAPS